jgi:hypothetical protein
MKNLGSGEEQRLEIPGSRLAHDVPGSRPRGGGSLHPASNLVYDHRCFTVGRRRRNIVSSLYLIYLSCLSNIACL